MVEFTLNGFSIVSPKGWQDTTINASFQSGVQPDISTDSFEFGGVAIDIIDSWISTYGVFRGCPIVISKNGYNVFEGYLDFNEQFIKVHSNKYIVAVKKDKGLNQLADYIEGYTMGLLAKNTNLNYYSVPYLVEKKTNALELAILSITTLLLLKETYEAIRRLSMSINKFSEAVGNTPFNVGLLVGAGIQVVIDVVYTGAIAIALKNNITELLSYLISPIRYQKSINLKGTYNSFFTTLGYNGFETGITDLDNLYYFPSKNEDSNSQGIPNVNDYGYYMPEFIELTLKTFNAKIAIDSNNKVQLRTESDPYFLRNSTYVFPDVLLEEQEYNINDLNGTISLSFETDVTDSWTVDNFTGTAYDIYTKTTSNAGTNLVKGLDEQRFNICLGNRKNSLNTLEKALEGLALLADKLINTLGGNSNLASKITRRLGMLIVSDETWSKPKLLTLNSSLTLNSNHRTVLSAKALYNNYWSYKSFVLNNFKGQRLIYEGIEIPFCLEDFKKCVDNSYFTINGNTGKFTNLQMGLDSEKATADFWIENIYDKNLIEETIEP